MNVPHSRQKKSIRCTICGEKRMVRRDYLKSLEHDYWCLHCRPVWRPKTFEDHMRLSISHRKYNLDESFFKKINNEEKAYWLGFFAGDGSITENKVRLRLANKDREHLQKFKKAVNGLARIITISVIMS